MSREIVQLYKDNALAAFQKADDKQKQFMRELFPDVTFKASHYSEIKSFEDACEVLGKNPLKVLPYSDQALSELSGEDLEEAMVDNDIKRVRIITKAINFLHDLKWSADYNNHSQYKWVPWFVHDKGASAFRFVRSDYLCSLASSLGGARLVFATRELSDHFGKTFIDLMNNILIIKNQQ